MAALRETAVGGSAGGANASMSGRGSVCGRAGWCRAPSVAVAPCTGPAWVGSKTRNHPGEKVYHPGVAIGRVAVGRTGRCGPRGAPSAPEQACRGGATRPSEGPPTSPAWSMGVRPVRVRAASDDGSQRLVSGAERPRSTTFAPGRGCGARRAPPSRSMVHLSGERPMGTGNPRILAGPGGRRCTRSGGSSHVDHPSPTGNLPIAENRDRSQFLPRSWWTGGIKPP